MYMSKFSDSLLEISFGKHTAKCQHSAINLTLIPKPKLFTLILTGIKSFINFPLCGLFLSSIFKPCHLGM